MHLIIQDLAFISRPNALDYTKLSFY